MGMEWKEYKLGDFCTFQEGYVNPPQTNHEYFDGDVKWVRAVDLNNAKVYDTTRKLTQKGFLSAKKSAVLFEPNTIVISKSGTIGRLGLIQDYMCGNRATINIKPLPNTNINYIFYLLLNNQEEIANQAVGSVQKNLYVSILENIRFKFPSLEDQKRIADILSSLDAKIENNNKINAKLEEMAQALFKSWFIDFEPFKVGRDGSRPAFGSGNFVESELGMIPEGWKVGSPYEYFDVIYGAPYKSALFNSDGNGLPLIRIRDLKDCKPQFYSPEILPNTEFVEYGDIVAGMDAEFTPYVWRGERGLLNQRVCKIVPKNMGISRLYGLLLFKPELEYVQSYKTGTTVSHLGKADIDRFKVILPSECIAKQFSAIVDSILNEQILLAKEINNLSQTRDTLLPKLMSGEIEIESNNN